MTKSQEPMSPRRAIELATTIEELGAQYYRNMARKFFRSPRIADVFWALALDETSHGEEFATLLQGLPKDWELEDEADRYEKLRSLALTEFFINSARLDADLIRSPEDALRRALDFERATLRYYQTLASLLGETPQINHLIKSEQQHVATVARALRSMSRVHADA